MPIPVQVINGQKTFTVLENNPEVMNALGFKLGLSPSLQFHDIYSLTDPTLLALIPRPVHALLVILPLTPAWHANRVAEDSTYPALSSPPSISESIFTSDYNTGEDEQWGGIVWFKQTIGHACGSIGLLHCAINGPARKYIEKGSTLEKLREQALPLGVAERAQMLYDDLDFETAHQSVAEMGDTAAPSAEAGDKLGQHFVTFVKGDDGKLWELEGSRKGPLFRGMLADDEDVLSERGLALGLGRVIEMEKASGGGDLRFSAIALAGKWDD
ncbi:Ubiquitin carboxyl-terminal hydrolase isozyme L3 [Lachnellula hyalina]|uniref:Ubiquitin carboxyl-terminal hydrolase n=1 Tax=Lachnellula hyalina TaxID=1316788 RepID=A0A8H8U0G6_9HELO|nr:Ubiquitin carboxyl-terminal hydrolase isozyme L3 [Lachnellula hyalina]TVY27310.1 Ubiquitin carboxyl-terminal hydrolase isozyme L3 [Lachnellula hyalina]